MQLSTINKINGNTVTTDLLHVFAEDGVRDLLLRISNSWTRRAQVKKQEFFETISFDPEKDDFIESLLPFKDHHHYQHASCEMKQKILSCGWIIYNRKTLAIETEIINPVCVDILAEKIPGVVDTLSKQIVSETMVDESYHVLLVTNAIGITASARAINPCIPKFNIVHQMHLCQDAQDEAWKKTLVQLATSIVSEIFISDYLKVLSDDKNIQPFNRLTVATHRKDEVAHANIFKQLTKNIYSEFNQKQKDFFASMLAKPVRWFADKDLLVWHEVLTQLGFSKADEMIGDCWSINKECLQHIDYSDLIALAEEIGIINIASGFDSFQQEGLI